METKYVIVTFPEIQKYMDCNRWDECFQLCTDEPTYIVPEDLYEWINRIKIPDKYKDTYTENIPSDIKRGTKVLLFNYDTEEFIEEETQTSSRFTFPLLFKDISLLEGINCDIIGIEK